MSKRVFISHSAQDEHLARDIEKRLRAFDFDPILDTANYLLWGNGNFQLVTR